MGEVIAFLGGRPITDPPELLASALPTGARGSCQPASRLVRSPRLRVPAMASNSELRDLWIDSGELDAWIHVVDDLLNRLG
ncbi:MAG: hypothetical protein R3B49_06020 [Phycisphaerales bacterium]